MTSSSPTELSLHARLSPLSPRSLPRTSPASFTPLNLTSTISVPLTLFPLSLTAWRQKMGQHRPLAAALWTHRRAPVLCYMLGQPPASAESPSSIVQTATMTCHPRLCPETHQSPAKREQTLPYSPDPLSLALPQAVLPNKEWGIHPPVWSVHTHCPLKGKPPLSVLHRTYKIIKFGRAH